MKTITYTFGLYLLIGCTDVHVDRDVKPDSTLEDDAGIVELGPDGKPVTARQDAGISESPPDDAGVMSPPDDNTTAPPANTLRCTLGVDCDTIAFDCSGCDDNNTCTTDVCDVNKSELSRTCSHAPITQGLCVGGVDKMEELRAACHAKSYVTPKPNQKLVAFVVTFDFQSGACHTTKSPYTLEHKLEVVQAYCCEDGPACGDDRLTRDCEKVL